MIQETLTRLHQIIEPHEAHSRALVDYDNTIYSYGDLRLSLDDANAQLYKNGVKAGDRVLLIAENSAAAVAFILAASRIDAWVVLVNSRLTETEITRIIAHARPRIAIFTTDASDEARRHAQRADATTVVGRFGTVAISTLHPSNPEPVREGDDQVAVMLYTTGTTGQPKGVMLTHGNLLFGAAVSGALRNMTPQDKLFAALPLTHVFGLASVVMAGLRAGSCVHLCNRFSPKVLYQALVSDGITVLPAVPQMHAALMQYLREQGMERIENHQLRYVSSGGAPLDPAWKRAVEKFIGLPLHNGYGLTETTSGVCATNTIEFTDDVSVGPPLPGVEVQIEAPDDASDGIGEILTRGPHIMAGYYNDPEETAKVLEADGWLHTGDMGYLDDQGRLHISGRSKELIIRSGFNVFPPEVEAALSEHPDVAIAAVIGRKIEGNEEVIAFVQPAAGATPDEAALKSHAASRLAGYKCPARIIMQDKLPATATGKILKAELVKLLNGEQIEN